MKNPLRLLPTIIPAGNISVFLDYRQKIALLLEKFSGSGEPKKGLTAEPTRAERASR